MSGLVDRGQQPADRQRRGFANDVEPSWHKIAAAVVAGQAEGPVESCVAIP